MAFPAKVVTLVVSDVPGDNPAQVASGPTVPDASDADDAMRVIGEYRIDLPARVIDFIRTGRAPTDDVSRSNAVDVIASARVSLDAAASLARKKGVEPLHYGARLEGQAERARDRDQADFFINTVLDRTDWLEELSDMVVAGDIKLKVTGEYPPENTEEAQKAIEPGGQGAVGNRFLTKVDLRLSRTA